MAFFKRRKKGFVAGTAEVPRVYGNDKTWHQTEQVNVEIHNGVVVAVWFRCTPLPFDVSDTDKNRAVEMTRMYGEGNIPGLVAVELIDKE